MRGISVGTRRFVISRLISLRTGKASDFIRRQMAPLRFDKRTQFKLTDRHANQS
jgi:hypothetical protein